MVGFARLVQRAKCSVVRISMKLIKAYEFRDRWGTCVLRLPYPQDIAILSIVLAQHNYKFRKNREPIGVYAINVLGEAEPVDVPDDPEIEYTLGRKQ